MAGATTRRTSRAPGHAEERRSCARAPSLLFSPPPMSWPTLLQSGRDRDRDWTEICKFALHVPKIWHASTDVEIKSPPILATALRAIRICCCLHAAASSVALRLRQNNAIYRAGISDNRGLRPPSKAAPGPRHTRDGFDGYHRSTSFVPQQVPDYWHGGKGHEPVPGKPEPNH